MNGMINNTWLISHSVSKSVGSSDFKKHYMIVWVFCKSFHFASFTLSSARNNKITIGDNNICSSLSVAILLNIQVLNSVTVLWLEEYFQCRKVSSPELVYRHKFGIDMMVCEIMESYLALLSNLPAALLQRIGKSINHMAEHIPPAAIIDFENSWSVAKH